MFEELLKSHRLLVDMRSGWEEGWPTSKGPPVNTKECSRSGESADTYFVLQDFYLCVGCFFFSNPWLVRAEVSGMGLWNVSEESIVWKPALCILGSFPS